MSSSLLATLLSDHSSSFREDAPRPPVPGEEGQTTCQLPMRSQRSKSVPVSSNPRRDEDGMGEPEGSASPDSPLTRWTKSLHSLLGDKEGADLFRIFLEREKCVDTLDFWFACNGFRQMDLKDAKTLRVAKAIYKRYIESCSIISKQLKPLTKSFLKDFIKKQLINSTMFDQAQSEIHAVMEDNAYQVFLTSNIYLECVQSGGENAAYFSNVRESGILKVVSGYLPTVNEEEEWSCVDLKQKTLPSVVGLSSKALRATISLRSKESVENGYRSYKRNNLINPYHVISGHVFAPATSANESEISSDALTDDSMSVTDSSLDGVQPYRMGSKKQLQREMARSVKANGLVSLPPFHRTHRLPREMTPVEPAEFAAELIVRLEKVKEKQEEKDSVEEQNITEEEEEEEEDYKTPKCIQPMVPAHQPLPSLSLSLSNEDAQAILDDHLSRVLKTPGCQSPGMDRHSLCPHSPDRPCPLWPTLQPVSPCALLAKGFVTKQTTKHVHHHYIHHHTAPKSKAEIEAEAARRVQCICSSSSQYCCYLPTKTHSKSLDYSLLPLEHAGARCGSISRKCCKMTDCPGDGPVDGATLIYQLPGEEFTANNWQQVVGCEKERQSRHKAHSLQHIKKTPSSEPHSSSAEHTIRHHTCNGHPRNLQPSQLSPQEQAVPPVPPPSTLAQLEEACRRLNEVSKPQKQRCSVTGQQRIHPVNSQLAPSPNTTAAPVSDEHKEPKRLQAPHSPTELMVTYFFCEDKIPYRWTLKSRNLTLGHFKEQLSKKGNYRYGAHKYSRLRNLANPVLL
ncbi:axin-2 isoform X2 [Xenopus laevis]|uniref:Axin-2 isoform X2 n=1 Tax=Xenopus laevis TaxID=8355 RepID=A0A8J1LX85_XENLA|nr:axin-2 isoform X2 [Xenopus laevis]